MAKIPPQTQLPTRLKVDQLIEDQQIKSEVRKYLGLSGIGNICSRKLWYGFRLCTEVYILPEKERIFNFGHRTEPYIRVDLEKAGMWVHADQQEIITGHGHIKGHIDGLIDFVPDAPKTRHLLELKTMKNTSFNKFKAKAVEGLKEKVKIQFPEYYAQVQVYMRLLELTRCLFIAECKNTSKRYYERIRLDKNFADKLLKKGRFIVGSKVPPARISSNPDKYPCSFCEHKEVCHKGKEPLKNCRTCRNSILIKDGGWNCNSHNINLAFDQQQKGCNKHDFLPGLVK